MAHRLIPSNAIIKSIKPGDARHCLTDRAGLYLRLFVRGGSHGWCLDYRLKGRRMDEGENMSVKVNIWTGRIIVAFCLWLAGSALGQVPIADLFRQPKIASATLSPNGKFLAATASMEGNLRLVMFDLEKKSSKVIGAFDKKNVVGVRWINNQRLLFSIVNLDGEQNSTAQGLYAVDRDGGHLQAVLGRPRFGAYLYGSSRKVETDILVGFHGPNRELTLSRVPTVPREATTLDSSDLDYKINGLATDFVIDNKDTVRIVIVHNANHSRMTLWYRDADSEDFRKLSEHDASAPPFTVLAFDADDKTMLVAAPMPNGRQGIFKFDFAKNAPGELLASDKWVDVQGRLIQALGTRKLLGINVESDPPRTVWLDTDMAKIQQQIDAALPGRANDIDPGEAGAPMLVVSRSSTQQTQYLIYNPATREVKRVLESRPWIDASKMSVQDGYDYQARDGLPIPAYLTLPKGRPTKDLPLIVLVHGGPWARDHWGLDPEVQFLAGLGYAVLQPQFRGSTGLGSQLFEKSFGEWGLSMQDDVTDGVLSLTKQGVVDPKRVCIMGASYGGYAAMMGVVKDPDFYRCAVNLFGVTNLFYHHDSKYFGDRALNYGMNMLMGDRDKLRDQFTATSPSKQAHRIKVPVFMAYGEHDQRVPLIHGEEMRDALKKAGKAFEYMELENEEHGLAHETTRVRVFERIEAFLRAHNPP